MNKSKIKRILLITLSNIGDIVLTTPVLEALLCEFPDAALDIMVGPNGRELFKSHKKIRNVIIYDKKSKASRKFLLYLRLLKNRYSLVVDLRNTVLPLILGARFITNPLRHGQKDRGHKVETHLLRLRGIGIDVKSTKFYIPIEEEDKKHADNLLQAIGGKRFIALSPGAKSHVKRWPLKNFAKLCDRIKEELGMEVVLIGDEYDRVVIERILFCMKTVPLNLIEKTNIRELAYIIGKANLLITNDSAPLHVGSAQGATILAFFGPTDEKKYGPVTKNKSRVLRKNIKCSPCEVPQCINYDNKYGCLKLITVEEAFEAVKELLEQK